MERINLVQNSTRLMPDVSVILTVYNRANYLERCLNSLLGQSFKKWELVAIDDGSIDNSYKILKRYELNYKNITVIRQENMKLPLSRNRGINVSTGKYITFLDSDDEYESSHLKKRIDYMTDHPEIDLIHGGVDILGDKFVRDKNNPNKFIHLSECAIGATFFGKRNVFLDLNGFKNLEYSEDSEFLERAEKLFNIAKVEFNTYKYHRESPDSITKSYVP